MGTDVLTVNGGHPLTGDITVRGAKNLVPKAMVAALLGTGPSELRNVPGVRDVGIVAELLELHGVRVDIDDEAGIVRIDPGNLGGAQMQEIGMYADSSRIPILLCGPLLHRLGEAFIPDLGGCEIGGRPIDFHLNILREMGATVTKEEHGIRLTVSEPLHGTQVTLPYPSVGATEQLLLAAVMATGLTELRNAAVEPEIIDLVAVLQKMGAIIAVEADRVIHIEGVEKLTGFIHTALPDRIEAASWASAALATGGDIFVRGARQEDMMTYLNIFRKAGGGFEIHHDGIRFFRKGELPKSVAVETDVHPGFMTDWQQPLVVALTQADGLSVIHETVYEERFGFTRALNSMGARIQLYRDCLGGSRCRFGQKNHFHSAVIAGHTPLQPADITIPDLRGGFSHVIAALTAKGTSRVSNISLIDRGYEHFASKLEALKADFSRD